MWQRLACSTRRPSSCQLVEMTPCPLGWFPCPCRENFPTSWEHGKNHVHIFSTPASHVLGFREEEFNRLDRFIATGYAISLGNILVMGREGLAVASCGVHARVASQTRHPRDGPLEGTVRRQSGTPGFLVPFSLPRLGLVYWTRAELENLLLWRLLIYSEEVKYIRVCTWVWVRESRCTCTSLKLHLREFASRKGSFVWLRFHYGSEVMRVGLRGAHSRWRAKSFKKSHLRVQSLTETYSSR